MDQAVSESLLASPTFLRRLGAGEAPYPAVLCAGDPPTVCVDETDLPALAWRAAPDGHILAPVEVVRTDAGVCALLAHCRGRLDVADGGTDGRIVTIAVSILRAAVEAGALGGDEGQWWVDAGGRPVLALGVGGAWRDAAAQLLTAWAERTGGALGRALAAVAEGVVSDSRVRRDADAWEDALFSAAEAAPLGAPSWESAGADGAPGAPVRAAALRRDTASTAADTWISRLLDADVARRTADALESVRATAATLRSRLTRRRPASTADALTPRRRRGPVFLAVGVAGALAMAGILWPNGTPSEAAPSPRNTVSAQQPDVAPTPSVGAPSEPAASPLERSAREALGVLARCLTGEGGACAASREDPSMPPPDGLVASGEPITAVHVLDEYGGVAVVRVDGAGFASQAVVLVQAEEGWLVRDVYDLADQP